MRTRFLASSQSCRSTDVDDWCKRALKCCRNTMVDRIWTWMITLILVCTSFIGYLHCPPDLRKYRWLEWRSTLPLLSSLSAATLSKSVHNAYTNVYSLFHVLPYAVNLFLPTTRESNVFTDVCLCTEGTPSGQRLQWTETSRYWHLVGPLAAVGTRPTGMHSCHLLVCGSLEGESEFIKWQRLNIRKLKGLQRW